MITLKRDSLSITFPEIARQVRLIVERQIQKIASELPQPWDRAELLSQIESSRDFPKLSPAAQENARTKLNNWTPTQVEAALREAILNRGGLNTDAFTELAIKFQRTMRIPDDGKTYPLPTDLGQLPLRSVDDFSQTAPGAWMEKGGVIMPLARSEALWIWFSSRYRFAVKIGAGKFNMLSGEPWSPDLRRRPQNYLVAPGPPWSENNEVLRRYAAMPLDAFDSADCPLGAAAEAGGIHFQIAPMCAESHYREEGAFFLPPTIKDFFMKIIFAPMISAQLSEIARRHEPWELEHLTAESIEPVLDHAANQEILEDPYDFAEWDQSQTVRCFVHSSSSSVWQHITGANPPLPPLTAKDYKEASIPWFSDYQGDIKPFPEGFSIALDKIVQYRKPRRLGEIREFLDIR
jgi:hypothetical protein